MQMETIAISIAYSMRAVGYPDLMVEPAPSKRSIEKQGGIVVLFLAIGRIWKARVHRDAEM